MSELKSVSMLCEQNLNAQSYVRESWGFHRLTSDIQLNEPQLLATAGTEFDEKYQNENDSVRHRFILNQK